MREKEQSIKDARHTAVCAGGQRGEPGVLPVGPGDKEDRELWEQGSGQMPGFSRAALWTLGAGPLSVVGAVSVLQDI